MKRIVLLLFVLCSLAQTTFGAECPIFPIPKEYTPRNEQWVIPPETVIVCDGSTQQERYAAERLRDQIKLRFDTTFPIVSSEQIQGNPLQIVLGLPGQNTKLDSLLKHSGQTVTPQSPGFNGYVITFVQDGTKRSIVLAGSDVNGVIFGQESLFDMFKRDKTNKNNIVVEAATIRDWPSIPWRGRPHSVLAHHLRNGELDGYIRARLNYSDVRDNPKTPASLTFDARKASMGIPPGEPMDTELLSKMIKESHRRGIFIYGTVSCSIPLDRFDVLTKTYDDLIKLGVDGLWISMDDTGGGNNPVELIRKIVAYCKSRGMTGRRVAFTPPPAEYQNIDKPLNRDMAKVQGFDDITWFFTRVPCKADLAKARELGIKSKPAWWYNYVETGKYDGKCGFLHTSYLLTTLRKDGRPGYMDLQPLRWGWGFPEYDKIRDAADNTDQVHMWGLCGGWPTEYALANIGLWAWDPQTFDWEKFRHSVYRYVYGDSLVETMCQFDTKLDELKQYYQLASSGWRYNPADQWSRLKDVKDRPEVIRRIRELVSMSKKISAEAVKESALDRERLEYQYLEPMRASLAFAEKFATFDYLDYDYGTLSHKLEELFFDGKHEEAKQLHAEAIPVIRKNLARFEKTFAELKGVELYKAKWERIISITPKQWTEQLRAKMEQRWKTFAALSPEAVLPYLKTGQQETLDSLFANYANKPSGKVIATIRPEDWLKAPLCIRGNSLVGLYRRGNTSFVGIGLPQNTPTVAGDRAGVRFEMKKPAFDKTLVLRFYAADTRIDDSARKYRRLILVANDKEIWSEDIAFDQRGKEWRQVDISEIAKTAKTIKFQFFVEELRPVGHHSSIAFLGDMILIDK